MAAPTTPRSSPVRVHSVQNRLKLWVRLPFLHHGQVIAQGAQAGLELLVIQAARFVLVKVSAAQSQGQLSTQAPLLSPASPARQGAGALT